MCGVLLLLVVVVVVAVVVVFVLFCFWSVCYLKWGFTLKLANVLCCPLKISVLLNLSWVWICGRTGPLKHT